MSKFPNIRKPEEGAQPIHVFKADFQLFHQDMLVDFVEHWSAQSDEAMYPRRLTYEEWLEQYHAFVEMKMLDQQQLEV